MTWDQQLPTKLTYIAFGKETAPTTGKEHYQAFAYAKTAMRLSGWNKIFKGLTPHTRVEEMRGTFSQNEKYCSKEGQYTTLGEKPMENGKRRDLLVIKDLIDSGEKLDTLVQEEVHFGTVMQYKRGLDYYEHVIAKKRRNAEGYKQPLVHIITGSTGSGKSRIAFDKHGFDKVYIMPDHKLRWCGTYNGQTAVLFDEVRPGSIMPIETFLRIVDGYPVELECKGGYKMLQAGEIYFTSNTPFRDWWPAANAEDYAAAERRITTHMNGTLWSAKC